MPRSDKPKLPDLTKIEEINETIEQLGAQTVRDKVLAAYNQRLAEIESYALHLTPDELARKRFRKLSSDELLMLALTFVAYLIEMNQQSTDTEAKIKELCEAETTLLEKGYPQETIAKNHHPLYINLVNDAIKQGKLPISEQNFYSFEIYKQTGELETITAHYAQLYLKYDREFYRSVKRQSNERNNIKQDTPKPVRLYPYLDKIKELLQSELHTELAVGIAAATGRRFSEVIERGTFVIPDKPDSAYELIFEGQLKKSSDAPPYSAYSLVPAPLVVAALHKLRAIPKIAQLKGATTPKINTLLPTVNYQIKRHLQETGIVEVLEGEAGVTVHNLRGIYGEIAAHFFCPSRAQFPRFLSGQLGHLIGDETIDNNLSHSTEHYFHYYLVDEDGQKIEQMGIKLDEPMPEKNFVSLAQEFLTSDDPWCKLTGVIALTGVAPDDLLKHFVYKGVENEHTILYTRLVHSINTPYLQLITLVDAAQVYEAISQLKIHPELKPYLDTHTGKQINAYVRERIADYLGRLGVETYSMAITQYLASLQQLGLKQIDYKEPTQQVDNKPTSIKTVAKVKQELSQLKSILGTSSYNETLIEIIQLAKLALSHQQKLVTGMPPNPSPVIEPDVDGNSPGSASLTDNNDEPAIGIEVAAPPNLNPNSTSVTQIEQLSSVEDELNFLVDESAKRSDESVIKKDNPEESAPLPSQTSLPELSSQESTLPTPAVSQPIELSAAISVLVQSMTLLTSKFDQFLEKATVTSSFTPKHKARHSDTSQPTQRRPRQSNSTTVERIHAAINALMDYNKQVDHELRWYISAPVLKALAGGAQVSINETLSKRKDELDSHHQSNGLGTQHNRSFHQGHKITDFVTLEF